MKKILLSSAAVFALAGAAAADITFTGVAELGFNDTDNGVTVDAAGVATDKNDDNNGFYADLEITAGLSAELDNGLTAAASLNLEDLGNTVSGTDSQTAAGTGAAATGPVGSANRSNIDYTLSLTSETTGLFYGNTTFAAENLWTSAGDMEADGFSESDGEEVFRSEANFGAIEAQLSYALSNANGVRVGNAAVGGDSVDQLALAVAGDFGGVNVVAAYQADSGVNAGAHRASNGDFNEAEIFGLSVGTTLAGADIRLAYATQNGDVQGDGTADDRDSVGLRVAYPIGPVTATAYFVSESVGKDNWGINAAYEDGPFAVSLDYQDDQGTAKVGLEGSFDAGNGLMMFAGYLTEDNKDDRFYVAGTYDLGSGAELLVSFAADDSDVDEDEIGAGDYQEGTTIELSFEF